MIELTNMFKELVKEERCSSRLDPILTFVCSYSGMHDSE